MRKTLTVGHLAILVGAVAIAFGFLLAPDSVGIWSILAAYFLSLFSRWRRYTLIWCPAALALAVATVSAGGACSPGYAGAFISSLVAIPGFLVCLAMTGLVLFACRRDVYQRRRARWIAVVSLIAIALIVPMQWPFCLLFSMSRHHLGDFADKVEAGYRMSRPERVGRFLILAAEVKSGRPCLWTDTNPSGYAGFVRNPSPGGTPISGRVLNTAFNHGIGSPIVLDRDWAFINED